MEFHSFNYSIIFPPYGRKTWNNFDVPFVRGRRRRPSTATVLLSSCCCFYTVKKQPRMALWENLFVWRFVVLSLSQLTSGKEKTKREETSSFQTARDSSCSLHVSPRAVAGCTRCKLVPHTGTARTYRTSFFPPLLTSVWSAWRFSALRLVTGNPGGLWPLTPVNPAPTWSPAAAAARPLHLQLPQTNAGNKEMNAKI